MELKSFFDENYFMFLSFLNDEELDIMA